LVVTFDDEKTSLKIIINELKKGNFIVQGEPVYLKESKENKDAPNKQQQKQM
jgi:hypothetical protein